MSNHELAKKITEVLFTTKGGAPTTEGKNLRLYTDFPSNGGTYLAGLSKEAASLYIERVLNEHRVEGDTSCQTSV